MRRLLTFVSALAVVVALFGASAANAGCMALLGVGSAHCGSGGPGASRAWTKTGTSTFVQSNGLVTPQTLTQNIGTASSDRVVVCLFANLTTFQSSPLSSVTVNGTASTAAVDPGATSQRDIEIWYSTPGGISGSGAQNVAATFTNGGYSGIQVTCGTITGSATTTLASTQTSAYYPAASTNTNTASITVPSNGVAVIAGIADGSSSTSSWSGGGTTRSQTDTGYTANGSTLAGTVALATSSGSVTETVTTGGAGVSGWASASFQP